MEPILALDLPSTLVAETRPLALSLETPPTLLLRPLSVSVNSHFVKPGWQSSLRSQLLGLAHRVHPHHEHSTSFPAVDGKLRSWQWDRTIATSCLFTSKCRHSRVFSSHQAPGLVNVRPCSLPNNSWALKLIQNVSYLPHHCGQNVWLWLRSWKNCLAQSVQGLSPWPLDSSMLLGITSWHWCTVARVLT